MTAYGWLFDPKRCIECRACESACKQWNGVQTGIQVRYRMVSVRRDGVFPRLSALPYSGACNHCENALCAKACPTKAISVRPDGIVLIDQQRCVGCAFCQKFCPYHAPQLNAGLRKMEKCTMCADRVDAGLKPACVTLCPTGALQWGPWDDVRHRGADRMPGFSTPATTRPRIRFDTSGWPAR